MRLVRAMWAAMKAAFIQEVWAHLPVSGAPLPESRQNDSPAELSARLDAIEARLEQRRLRVLEIEAERPTDGRRLSP
jgi:hypothetical protein